MKCPQCAYVVEDEKAIRCPRCFKSLLHSGSCTNCGKCNTKLFTFLKKKK